MLRNTHGTFITIQLCYGLIAGYWNNFDCRKICLSENLLLENVVSENLVSENLLRKICCRKNCCRKNLLDPPAGDLICRHFDVYLELRACRVSMDGSANSSYFSKLLCSDILNFFFYMVRIYLCPIGIAKVNYWFESFHFGVWVCLIGFIKFI